MQKVVLKEEVYQQITDRCLAAFDCGNEDVFDLLQSLMDLDTIPMHYPYHHYIIPAVLLTACCHAAGRSRQTLAEYLETATARSKNVLAGFCGNYGACGAAVGVGIFFSVFTGTTPHSEEHWSDTNRATADALQKIAGIEGPRCCKRSCFLALQSAVESIREVLGISLSLPAEIHCHYSPRNLTCKLEDCPFYQKEA